MLNYKHKYALQLLENVVKKELFFDVDNFGNPKELHELSTLAFNIRNILLMKKGTMPDTPNMGIDLLSYKYDRLNGDTMRRLESDIEEQIRTFIGKNLIANIVITKRIDKLSGLSYVYFLFILTPTARSITKIEELVFKLLEKKNNLIFSKIEYR